MRKPSYIMVAMIGIFTVTTILFLYPWLQLSSNYPEAQSGVLDATDWDFAGKGIIPLRGEWEFYAGTLLEPDDFRNHDLDLKNRKQMIHVPGNMFAKSDAGTYRLLIQVNQANMYALRAKKVRLSSHIFMNGKDLGGSGQPALAAESYIPSVTPFFGAAREEAGTIELIIHVASYNNLKGGLFQVPEFGLFKDVLARRDHSRLADMIVITMLLAFGLYYAGMFRQWRYEPHLMYFSLFCLSIGLFYSFDNEILISLLFPHFPFLLFQKMIFLLPYLSFFFFIHYVYRYLSQNDNVVFRWLRRISYVYLLVMFIAPNRFLISTLWLTILMAITAFLCIFYAIFRSRDRGALGSYYMLIGTFFLLVSWLYAQLRYRLALDNPYYMIMTPLLLVFSQALLMSDRLQEAYRNSRKLTEQLQWEMDFLQAQITPHFLYNSLNALVGLSYKDVDKLRETIYHLSTYLRAKFAFVFQGDRVPLERELELVQAYLAIEQLRFGDRLKVEYQIEEGLHVLLPPLTLQPIVENAVRHGIGPKPEGGIVKITATRVEGGVDIIVEDNGVGVGGDTGANGTTIERGSGVGFGNVNRRLQMLYGSKLGIDSEPGRGTRVKFHLPEDHHD